MVAATAQGYISPMTALASHALNGMANSVVPPTSGKSLCFDTLLFKWMVKLYFYMSTEAESSTRPGGGELYIKVDTFIIKYTTNIV